MNDSTIDTRDLTVLKQLLAEKIAKLEGYMAEHTPSPTGDGPREYFSERLDELLLIQERLRGR